MSDEYYWGVLYEDLTTEWSYEGYGPFKKMSKFDDITIVIDCAKSEFEYALECHNKYPELERKKPIAPLIANVADEVARVLQKPLTNNSKSASAPGSRFWWAVLKFIKPEHRLGDIYSIHKELSHAKRTAAEVGGLVAVCSTKEAQAYIIEGLSL